MRNVGVSAAPALLLLLASCAGAPVYLERDVHSVAVMPPMNDTLEVEAPKIFWPMLQEEVAENGYRTVPIDKIRQRLEEAGVHRGEELTQYTPQELGAMFEVDAVLFAVLTAWDRQSVVVYTNVEVGARFELFETKSGDSVWATNEISANRQALSWDKNSRFDSAALYLAAPYRQLAREVAARAGRRLPLPGYSPEKRKAMEEDEQPKESQSSEFRVPGFESVDVLSRNPSCSSALSAAPR